jgi:flagellar biosynthesis/type III secretory pathway chaperone
LITLPRAPAADDTLLERVSAALDAERDALMAGDEDRLSQAEREKASLLEALSRSDEQKKGPGSINSSSFNSSSLAPFSSFSPAARARLRELADKNRLNGLLIAERLGEVQRRRQFFERIAGRDSVYGPDGITRPASVSNLSSRI